MKKFVFILLVSLSYALGQRLDFGSQFYNSHNNFLHNNNNQEEYLTSESGIQFPNEGRPLYDWRHEQSGTNENGWKHQHSPDENGIQFPATNLNENLFDFDRNNFVNNDKAEFDEMKPLISGFAAGNQLQASTGTVYNLSIISIKLGFLLFSCMEELLKSSLAT